jgi:N-acetylglucosaminyldiphosphoundecaprenol N-acetyl-beta-D-mannosaminyltransferase
MQRTGLEWLFRLVIEPRRLGGRYLRTNPAFILAVLAQRTGLRRREMGG